LWHIHHLLISRVHRQSHFFADCAARAAMLDKWLPLSFVVQRNGNPQIQKQVYLQRGEMGFQVSHLRAAGAEDDSLLVDNGHHYHMGELNGKQKVRRAG